MKLNKRIWYVIVIIVVVGLAFWLFRAKRQPSWQPVKQGKVISAIYGLGTVQASNVFKLTSGLTSYIQRIYVDIGDSVVKGQKLVLYRDGQIIKAPFPGVVTAKTSNVHEIAAPQTSILTVTDLANLYILVSLDQDSLLKLNQIKNVKINFEALPGKVFVGKVASIFSSDNNFYLKIIPQHLPQKILPGMTADVAIVTNSQTKSVLIPLAAVNQGKVTFRTNKTETTVQVQIAKVDDRLGQVLSDNIPANARVRVD